MSLLLWRSRIVRAVAGELSGEKEAKMRSHLARCDGCRTYYDKVSITAEALGHNGTNAGQRERQRLLNRLSGIPAPYPVVPQRRWGMLFAPTLAVAGLAIWMTQGGRFGATPTEENPGAIQWRGTQDNQPTRETSFRVLIHARRKSIDSVTAPAVRLVAEFPGSGEGRVSLGEFVQFSYRGLREHSYFVLVGLRNGTVIPIIPGEGHVAIRIESTNHITGIGPSQDLQGSVPLGPLQLLGMISAKNLQEDQIRGTIAAWQRKGSIPAEIELISGLLIVEP